MNKKGGGERMKKIGVRRISMDHTAIDYYEGEKLSAEMDRTLKVLKIKDKNKVIATYNVNAWNSWFRVEE